MKNTEENKATQVLKNPVIQIFSGSIMAFLKESSMFPSFSSLWKATLYIKGRRFRSTGTQYWLTLNRHVWTTLGPRSTVSPTLHHRPVFANALFKGLLWELTQQGEKKVRRTQFTCNWGPFLHGTSHFCLSPCFPTPATAPQGCRLWRSARGERTSPSLAGSMAFDQRTIKRASYSGFLLYKRTVGLHNPGVAVSHITLSLFLWPVCLAADKAK